MKIAAIAVGLLLAAIPLPTLVLPDIELKNADAPFIDLGLEIMDSEPGHGGNTETGLEAEAEQTPETEAERIEVALVIAVRDTTIRINGELCDNTAQLSAAVQELYAPGMAVTLVDDYAESETYKAVLRELRKLEILPVEEAAE